MKTFDAEFLQKLERLTLPGTKLIQGGTGGRRRSKAKEAPLNSRIFGNTPRGMITAPLTGMPMPGLNVCS